jgi:hypothetical protein
MFDLPCPFQALSGRNGLLTGCRIGELGGIRPRLAFIEGQPQKKKQGLIGWSIDWMGSLLSLITIINHC